MVYNIIYSDKRCGGDGMYKHILVEGILNDDDKSVKHVNQKGVCQKCGHYTFLSMGKFGVRVCSKCNNQFEEKNRYGF